MQDRPERLGPHLDLLKRASTETLLSVASSWEIAIKYGLGRLELPEPPTSYVPTRLRAIRGRVLMIQQTHALAVADLPHIHGDPFDRLLVAQAQIEDLTVITHDSRIQEYDVETLAIG